MQKRTAAGGVVVTGKDGRTKVLLIKDAYGRWIWPKGHTEEGETPEETALREVSEETGLRDLEIISSVGKQEYWYTLKGERIFKTVRIFLMDAAPDQALSIQTEEVLDAKWFTPGEALQTIEYEGSRKILEKALRVYTDDHG
jgi:8-oxo-dGTP pyrophosphatase MutT (NUDIX family)